MGCTIFANIFYSVSTIAGVTGFSVTFVVLVEVVEEIIMNIKKN